MRTIGQVEELQEELKVLQSFASRRSSSNATDVFVILKTELAIARPSLNLFGAMTLYATMYGRRTSEWSQNRCFGSFSRIAATAQSDCQSRTVQKCE